MILMVNFSLVDFPQILGESLWINFVTTKWFPSAVYWVLLDLCHWNFRGWWSLSGRHKRWCHFRSATPGSALKDYLLKIDASPCPLQIQISHFSRGLEGPMSPLPHRKRQNSRKIILQVVCSTRYIILRSEFLGF